MKPTYWRCRNDNCGFFLTRKKKSPWNNPNKKNIDGARWLILKGHIEGPSWISGYCPQCGWKLEVNITVQEEKVDNKPFSILESFKELGKVSTGTENAKPS